MGQTEGGTLADGILCKEPEAAIVEGAIRCCPHSYINLVHKHALLVLTVINV